MNPKGGSRWRESRAGQGDPSYRWRKSQKGKKYRRDKRGSGNGKKRGAGIQDGKVLETRVQGRQTFIGKS